MSRVIVRCRAKINTVLGVLGRRADGFHDLDTVFESLELHDRLTLWPADDFSLERNVAVEGDADGTRSIAAEPRVCAAPRLRSQIADEGERVLRARRVEINPRFHAGIAQIERVESDVTDVVD